ncbi:MAG: tetratricopeptide repeat protein [Cyanophyceae cyanobacterium]
MAETDDKQQNIDQTHSGSGDNVAGDKSVHVAGDSRTVNTGGGDYREVNDLGQYAEGDINNTVVLPQPEIAERTGRINNLARRGIEDSSRFVGRGGELRELVEKLGGSSVVAITGLVGMGGVGKSELAVQFARQFGTAEKFPGGVVWLSGARLLLDLVAVAEGAFLTSADREKLGQLGTEAQQAQFCWSRWPVGRVLAIVDDVVEYKTKIKPLLPGDKKRFRVLLTTRNRKLLSKSDCLFLDVLDLDKSLELLGVWIGDERLGREGDLAVELVERLGRLPLAIDLVGAYLQEDEDLSLAQLLGGLEKKGLEAAPLTDATEDVQAERGVAAAFELSWERLSAGAQRLAVLLGCFGLAPVPWGLVRECLAGEDGEQLDHWRSRELQRLSLLGRQGEGLYRLHPLIWQFFGEKRAHKQDGEDLHQAFLNTLVAVATTVPEIPTLGDQARTRTAVPHLEHATQSTDQITTDDKDYIWPFNALGRLARAQSLWSQAEQYWKAAVRASENRCGVNHPDVAATLNHVVILYKCQGRYKEALPLVERSLSIYKKRLGAHDPRIALSLSLLAELHYSQGRYEDALPLCERALEIRKKQLGADHPETAVSLNDLAKLYKSQRRYEDALPLF